jgi:hypothetical protein
MVKIWRNDGDGWYRFMTCDTPEGAAATVAFRVNHRDSAATEYRILPGSAPRPA